MSLSSLVLRHLTVLALTDQTLAGKSVRSSLLEPLNEISAEPEPVIAVFTDVGQADQQDVHGLDLIGADMTVTLALETAVFARPPATDATDADLMIPFTDEGLEMTLDIVQRQALATLQAGHGPLADLWREVAMRCVGISLMRGASIEKGTRIAARRLEIKLRPISDPVPGAPLSVTWERAFAALESDQRTARFVPTLRAVAAGGPLQPSWRQAQNALGLTDAGLAGIGLGPVDGGDGEAAAATEIAADSRTDGTAVVANGEGLWLIDADGTATPVQAVP